MATENQERAIEMIEAQQKKAKERRAAWMVGEQLKDICRREPESAALIAEDLQNEKMSIAEAEKQIADYASKHRTGNFSCVTPMEADEILRQFYGLPKPGEAEAEPTVQKLIFTGPSAEVDLEDFF